MAIFFAAKFLQSNTLIIPVHGPIDYTQECIVRRGLKHAQQLGFDKIILDIKTPGGNCEHMLNIIDLLRLSKLQTIAFVNPEAISAGSFIANACHKIFFHPNGVMGAAAVINGNGKNLGDNLQAKIDSYLWAKIRTYCENTPHRYYFQRAMMDKDFVLKNGKDVLKPAGELLTLTAKEAIKSHTYLQALADGIFESTHDLAVYIDPQGEISIFEPTGFEWLARCLSPFLPIISGLGFFLLFWEFKTPGFGLFGLLGIGAIVLSSLIHFLAGLGGTEAFALLGLGIICIFSDIFLLGTILLSFLGVILVITGLWWSGIDIWPNIQLTVNDLLKPLPALTYAFLWWLFLIFIAWKTGLLKAGLNRLTLKKCLAHPQKQKQELAGNFADTLTPLMPYGKIKYNDRILEARAINGTLPAGNRVRIVGQKDLTILVEDAHRPQTD